MMILPQYLHIISITSHFRVNPEGLVCQMPTAINSNRDLAVKSADLGTASILCIIFTAKCNTKTTLRIPSTFQKEMG